MCCCWHNSAGLGRLLGIIRSILAEYLSKTLKSCRISACRVKLSGLKASFRQVSGMDKFDAAILDAIQSNNRLTAEALSKLVFLSPDSCRKRLAHLRANGYIDADIAVLNPGKLGRSLLVIVEVALTSERPADLDRFREKMKAAPEVMQCYYITGNSDFLLILSASDMADYEAFTRRYFFAEENIMKFKTSVVMDRVKTGFALPLPFLNDAPKD